MKRYKEEDLASVVYRALRLDGLETPLNEYRLVQSWPDVAGPTVAAYTGAVEIRNQKLFVQLKSPALRANLLMRRRELVDGLNSRVGAMVITDIVFR